MGVDWAEWLLSLPQSAANGRIIPGADSALGEYRLEAGVADGLATLDADGVVAHPVGGQLRAYKYVRGTLQSYNTTEDVGNYTLPDPHLYLEVAEGDIILGYYHVGTKVANDHYVMAEPMYTTDGGSTWHVPDDSSLVGYNLPVTPTRLALSGQFVFVVPSGVSSIAWRISIGTESGGSHTVYAVGYRYISALVFRGTSG